MTKHIQPGAAFAVALAALAGPAPARAAECTHQWDLSQVGTDPTKPKGLSGDANAAYPVFSFRGNPHIRYVIKGKFPRARFMSFETVQTQKDKSVDKIFDRDIVPDAGSANPFQEGEDIEAAARDYTIEAVPEGSARSAPNLMKLPRNRLLHSFMMRIYAPNSGGPIAKQDIPRIFAYDAHSARPVACPRELYSDPYFHFPFFLDRIFKKKPSFVFEETAIAWGPNSAIPSYLYGVNEMERGSELVVVRFKAPTYNDTAAGGAFSDSAETRYWSICTQNAAKNQTLGCLPDHKAHPDADGIVTVVVGQGAAVRAAAAAAGHDFIEDKRGTRQSTVQFAYRNIFPSAAFKAEGLYKGPYLPRGVLCETEDYLNGRCGH